jgi:hypothetical protein
MGGLRSFKLAKSRSLDFCAFVLLPARGAGVPVRLFFKIFLTFARYLASLFEKLKARRSRCRTNRFSIESSFEVAVLLVYADCRFGRSRDLICLLIFVSSVSPFGRFSDSIFLIHASLIAKRGVRYV